MKPILMHFIFVIRCACFQIKEAISPEVPSSPMNGKQIAPGILLVPHADVTPKLNSKKQTFPQKGKLIL